MTEREQVTVSEITAIINDYFRTDWGEDRDAANEILNITDSAGNKLLGIIAEDQSLPRNKIQDIDVLGNNKPSLSARAYSQARQDMLNANFVKLVKE